VLRGTHELDVFYDPFTCEKMWEGFLWTT
jgi:hypothetical protein